MFENGQFFIVEFETDDDRVKDYVRELLDSKEENEFAVSFLRYIYNW